MILTRQSGNSNRLFRFLIELVISKRVLNTQKPDAHTMLYRQHKATPPSRFNRKRLCVAKNVWIISGLIIALLLQSPFFAPAALVVFLLTLFGVLMFLDESKR
jgi:hypothetical protein